MKRLFVTVFLLQIALISFSQEIGYDVRPEYRYPITQEKLMTANTLTDINPGFPVSWVKGYNSVVVSAYCGGNLITASGKNEQLTDEQSRLLKLADLGSVVSVNVDYTPSDSKAEPNKRNIKFEYTIIPAQEASYPGGREALMEFVKENAFDRLPDGGLFIIKTAYVHFNIDHEGKVSDIKLTVPSGFNDVDALLLDTLKKMPLWTPARDINGKNVKQEFVFSLGYESGC